MPGIGDWIKKATEGATGGFLTGVKDVIGTFIADPTEKLKAQEALETLRVKHEEEMAKIALDADRLEVEKEKAYLADIDSARESNTKIQESDKASWMAKNIAYCLDVFFVLAFISMLVIIIYKQVPNENKELFYTAFGLLGGYVSTIINFHRGSSIGSKANGDALRKMANK